MNKTRNIPKTWEATIIGYENVSVFSRRRTKSVIFKDNLATEKQISDTKSDKHFVHLFEK